MDECSLKVLFLMLSESFLPLKPENGALNGSHDMYLIRIPQELDIESLEGKKVNLSSSASSTGVGTSREISKSMSTEKGLYHIVRDDVVHAKHFRPIEANKSSFHVGKEFVGCLSVERDIQAEIRAAMEDESKEDKAVITDNYAQRLQAAELEMHYVPSGCTSTISSLRDHGLRMYVVCIPLPSPGTYPPTHTYTHPSIYRHTYQRAARHQPLSARRGPNGDDPLPIPRPHRLPTTKRPRVM